MSIRLRSKTLKTGLAVMLAGLFFFIDTISSAGHASERAPFVSDSTIIERHMWEIAVENSIEEFSEHSFNSHLTRAKLDSILWEEERMRIVGGRVTWSPDSAFRICTIHVEYCGAYCNPSWMSWLHFNDGTGLVASDLEFGEITGIHVMPDNKYLLLETSYGRSGMFSCRTDGARLLSISDHKVIYHSIPNPERADESRQQIFSVGTCSYMNTDCNLSYNNSLRELSYIYPEDAGYISIPDSVTIYEGILSYVDSSFIIKKSQQRRIKFVAPE